ncbi:MAG: histidine phosphatase family protein [Candidatus Shapirobacteria bacterium]|nr:histidine phosphatase family protein [Candidatus Shapirobacteria bacterium]
MKLILIRHGESEANRDRKLAIEETKLTQEGIKQAKEAGKKLKEKYKIDMIFCSPLKRCVETLESILVEYPIEGPVFMCKLLEERDLGEYKGMEMQLIDLEELDQDNKINDEMGVESWVELKKRTDLFLEDLKLENENSTILVIAHDGSIRMMINKLTGKSIDEIEVNNAEIMEFEIETEKV